MIKHFCWDNKSMQTLSTPMHWAAKRGFMVIAEILIANKADIDGKDEVK